MAAYELVDCGSGEEAVSVASLHPMARVGAIEVRPVWEELLDPPEREHQGPPEESPGGP
jgi:hypothetical protein